MTLDIAAGKMYWTNQGPDDIRRANLDGSGREILVQNLNDPSGIALDTANGMMYWANFGGGDIRRASLDGTGQQTLITGLNGPGFISLDVPEPSCLSLLTFAAAGMANRRRANRTRE